jgi:hypothetical protein
MNMMGVIDSTSITIVKSATNMKDRLHSLINSETGLELGPDFELVLRNLSMKPNIFFQVKQPTQSSRLSVLKGKNGVH